MSGAVSSPATPAPLIDARELTRHFGSVVAVDRVSFAIGAGEIFGLIGSNGAGKSTLVKMLCTLLPPTSGTAAVAGSDIVDAPARVRASIGYVPQLVSADGALTGYENLRLSAKLYGIPGAELRTRVDEALAFAGIAEAADRLVRTYSGGMVRRLELAQAMLHRPAMLFLDEPTIGLDPVARHSLWDRLRNLRRDFGMTVLLTTHDMEEADLLCDELAILHAGRIVARGSPSGLRAEIGPDATLDEVFAHYTGGGINEGGRFRDARQTRATARRLG